MWLWIMILLLYIMSQSMYLLLSSLSITLSWSLQKTTYSVFHKWSQKLHIVSYWFCTFLFVNFFNDNVIAFFCEKLFYSEGNINEKLHYIVIFAVLFHHNVQNHFRKELNFLETEITVGLSSTCLFKNKLPFRSLNKI